jgi:hypothetical protein
VITPTDPQHDEGDHPLAGGPVDSGPELPGLDPLDDQDPDLWLPADLEETDAEGPESRRFDAWRRRTAIGVLGTGIALGLQEVFAPTDNEPVISAPAPGDPPDADQRIRVLLDPDDPTKSVAVIPAPRPPG